ncbi:RNA polymerase III subunit G [Lycorma delicatula]|uniref:RNA polymerase III subunit G n=1 Tax=Lycorma delicatula TaxID=130591 RepID=UPI003F516C0C
MAGRGRGGGGGRGRASLSFNVEQLGFSPGEMIPEPVLQPPPLYPTMEFYPASLETGPIYNDQVLFKTQFLNYLNNSSAFILADEIQKGLGNFIDADKENLTVTDKPLEYDWTRFPPELMPTVKKKRKLSKSQLKAVPNKIARKQPTNVTSLLDELEKKEVTDKDRESETEEKEKKKEDEEGEEEGGDKEEYEEEDLDEEMDDGTDYNLNYFDNGESYEDEDDNLDDGPIY